MTIPRRIKIEMTLDTEAVALMNARADCGFAVCTACDNAEEF